MPVTLPDLSTTRSHYVSFCGTLDLEHPFTPSGPIAGGEWQVAEYNVSGAATMVRCGWTALDGSLEPHLHLDFVRQDWFGTGTEETKPTIPIRDIDDLMTDLLGRPYSFQSIAYFVVRESELPPFVQRMRRPSSSSDIDVRPVSGSYEIRGGPIHGIAWRRAGDSDAYLLEFVSKVKRPIDAGLFIDALDSAEGYFAGLCLPPVKS